MKKIALDYENEVEKIFSMMNMENIKNILESMRKPSQE